MSSPTLQPPVREWHKQTPNNATYYLISTSPSKLSHAFINASFASKEMYWAKPLPARELDLMLAHSLTLGLYALSPPTEDSSPSSPRTPSPTLANDPSTSPEGLAAEEREYAQIGLARFTTDHVSFAYLSDVYIEPAHRASGLGAWLMQCCAEVLDGMPFLRRAMLMASEDVGQAYYARVFGMRDIAGSQRGLVCMTRKGPGSGLE